MTKTHRGFTLVELLIVIVVIGILSAMMMLSSNEAVTTARANNIASNLRNLKTAALAYYTDHMSEVEGSFDIASKKGKIFSYLSGKTNIPDSADYTFLIKDGKWYVQYYFDKAKIITGQQSIREKLKGRTKTLGLLSDGGNAYNGENGVRLRVR